MRPFFSHFAAANGIVAGVDSAPIPACRRVHVRPPAPRPDASRAGYAVRSHATRSDKDAVRHVAAMARPRSMGGLSRARVGAARRHRRVWRGPRAGARRSADAGVAAAGIRERGLPQRLGVRAPPGRAAGGHPEGRRGQPAPLRSPVLLVPQGGRRLRQQGSLRRAQARGGGGRARRGGRGRPVAVPRLFSRAVRRQHEGDGVLQRRRRAGPACGERQDDRRQPVVSRRPAGQPGRRRVGHARPVRGAAPVHDPGPGTSSSTRTSGPSATRIRWSATCRCP